MEMLEEDIILMYLQAKTPSYQITILSQLNDVPRREITSVLKKAGVFKTKYRSKRVPKGVICA